MGPRQSGKTTLARLVRPNYKYVNLENPDNRRLAEEDLRSFLEIYQDDAILDEVQYVPHLFSYLKVFTDERKRRGEYILTGSQNFLLMEKTSQSLAGRVAPLTMLPLSYAELPEKPGVESFIFTGGYPRIVHGGAAPEDFFGAYIQTYLAAHRYPEVISVSEFFVR